MNKIIAIIPARAGSKRLPKKNIMPLMGKPMIAWTIEAALESKIFSEVLVSTDGEDIAEVSRKCGAKVPFLRDAQDADDYTPAHIATLHALIKFEEYRHIQYDVVVQLMPNCPCRTSSDMIASYKNFVSSGAHFQISVFKFGWMNPWWALRMDPKTMLPEALFPEAYAKRSQDLEKLFCPTGAIWIAKGAALKEEKTFYGKGYKVFPLPWQSAVDIDDQDDFRMAEAVFLRKESGPKFTSQEKPR
ncbi:MAG: acylneuraminate cytidylyltransferase family protein [Candidatus Omnitrophota bacterium]